MQLHINVTALVMSIDQMMPASWQRDWITNATEPAAIIRNVGSAIPSVLRVRMVSMAWGK